MHTNDFVFACLIVGWARGGCWETQGQCYHGKTRKGRNSSYHGDRNTMVLWSARLDLDVPWHWVIIKLLWVMFTLWWSITEIVCKDFAKASSWLSKMKRCDASPILLGSVFLYDSYIWSIRISPVHSIQQKIKCPWFNDGQEQSIHIRVASCAPCSLYHLRHVLAYTVLNNNLHPLYVKALVE